jgi:hypothetical protein
LLARTDYVGRGAFWTYTQADQAPNALFMAAGDSSVASLILEHAGVRDYNDFVGKVSGIRPGTPVPEPTAAVVFLIGALLVGKQVRGVRG